jgi:hypothetical protein
MFTRCFDAFSNPVIISKHPFICFGEQTHFNNVMGGSIHGVSLLLTNIQTLPLSSTTGSPSIPNITSTLIVVLQHLHYSRASQQSPTLRLRCTSIHNQLQDRTLRQSIMLPANAERTTHSTAMCLLCWSKLN